MDKIFLTLQSLTKLKDFYSVIRFLYEKEQAGEIVLYAGTYSLYMAKKRFGSYEEASFYIYTTQKKQGYCVYLNRMGCGVEQDDKIFKFMHRRLYSKSNLTNCFFGEKDYRSGEFFKRKLNTCENCKDMKTIKNFSTPEKYLAALERIKELLASGDYEMEYSDCPLDKVKDENGYWIDDIIVHKIKCKQCGAVFICSCDTYHGKGSFRKGK